MSTNPTHIDMSYTFWVMLVKRLPCLVLVGELRLLHRSLRRTFILLSTLLHILSTVRLRSMLVVRIRELRLL